MTPQELMDLPYAGMAEKEVRKSGEWREDYTFDDFMEWASDYRVMIVSENKLIIDHYGERDIEDSVRYAMEAYA